MAAARDHDPTRAATGGLRPGDADVADADAEGEPTERGGIEALESAVRRGDLDAATETVRDHWFDLLHVHGKRVRAALGPLPAAALRDRPLLTMLLGLSFLLGGHRRLKALRLFAAAVRATHATRSSLDPAEKVLILASEAAAYRLSGRPAKGLGPAREAVELLDRITDRDRVSELPRIYGQLGISLYYGGAVSEALSAFEEGLAESPEAAPSSGFGNVAMLAGIHALRGDMRAAQDYVQMARSERWNDIQRSMYTGTFYRLAEAMLALERFETSTAAAHVGAMLHDRRTIEHWVAIANVEALISVVSGNPGAGMARLEAFALSRGAEGRSARLRRALAPARALLRLAMGSPEAAAPILRKDGAAGAPLLVSMARIELALGHTGSALAHVRGVTSMELTARQRAEAAALEAAIALRISSRGAAAAAEHLAGILEHTGQRLAVALLPSEDIPRVLAALDAVGYGHLYEDLEVPHVIVGVDAHRILTPRELEVLRTLSRSESLPQMAADMSVSVNTVKTQLKSIYRKLGVSNREEAVAVALDRHLVATDYADMES